MILIKKIILTLIITIVSLLLVSGLLRNKTETLRVSLWDYNNWIDDAFFDEFQKNYPKIKLKIESESWSNYHTKLNMQFITNTAPDVMFFKADEIYCIFR